VNAALSYLSDKKPALGLPVNMQAGFLREREAELSIFDTLSGHCLHKIPLV